MQIKTLNKISVHTLVFLKSTPNYINASKDMKQMELSYIAVEKCKNSTTALINNLAFFIELSKELPSIQQHHSNMEF